MSNVFVFRQPPPGFHTDYFGGGGKGGTTTQSVTIPPEVLARYNAVNARAEDVAKQPFQQYGGEFVAPVNEQQQAGMSNINAAANQAQPYFNTATGLTMSGARDVGPLTQQQIAYYQNPAMLATLDPTKAALQQQQGQQLSQQQSEAIKGGAFGGDRAGLQRQALRGQQQLGMGQALAPIYQQAYQTGLQTAMSQQGVAASDLARRMQAGQQIAGLGAAAQGAALQGAQAQMAAGQVGQQTRQAQDTAQYQQFLQERGYPFQVAQFLANIAMGTGALSGSTTTTTQPGGFFSDKRLKEDVKEIGKTNDGQPIYSYKYKGDDRTQIGLMAQDVEKKHPEAVGLMGGYKTVDYKKATQDAERTHKDMGGGLMPDNFDASSMGGAVMPNMGGEGFMRGGYVGGGLVGNDDWSQIIAANKAALGVYGGAQPMGGPIGAGGVVPQASLPTPKLVTAGAAPQQRPSGMSTAMQTGKDIANIYKSGKETVSDLGKAKDWLKDNVFAAHGGLIVPRHAYADGGMSEGDEAIPYDPSDVMGAKDPMEGVLKAGEHKIEPLKPAPAPGGGGGGSGLGDVASIMGSAAKIIPFFFKDGGLVPRQGYALQGAVDDIPAQATETPADQVPGDDRLDRTLGALRRIESGGKYDITGPASRTGDKPYGAYQIMGANIPSWTEAALGRRMTPDEFLQDQKAQDATAKHRAGLYLKQYDDPRQVASMWLSGKPMEKAGNVSDVLGTTVPKYVSMFDRYYGGQDLAPDGKQAPGLRPSMDIGRSTSSAEDKSGLGDTLTSEKFLVPALGFLGSMLASNRPNLGQALGEGIMGGVGAYQQQRKMLPEVAKNEAEATQQNVAAISALSTGLKQYNAMNGTNLTLQQFAKLSPAEIAKYAGVNAASAVSGKPTTSGGYSYTPEEMESLVIKRTGQPDIPASMDPGYLNNYKAHYASWGDNPYAKSQIAFADKQIERTGSTTLSSTGERIPAPGVLPSEQQAALAKVKVENANEFNKEGQQFRVSSQKIESALDELQNVYSQFRSGADAAARANFDRVMNVIDPNYKHPELHSGDAANYDTAIKDAMMYGLAQLGGLSQRAPAAELEAIKRTIPTAELSPETIQDILARTKADVSYKRKMYNSFDLDKDLDVSKFQKEFMRDNPYDKHLEETKKSMPAGAGTQQQRQQTAVPQSSEALAWAKSNPSDPRSAEILKRLGVQ